jgi:hypothetical protein
MYFSFSQETNQFCGWTEMQLFTFMKTLAFFNIKFPFYLEQNFVYDVIE